jgi:conjugative transfer signal peptidase TraF
VETDRPIQIVLFGLAALLAGAIAVSNLPTHILYNPSPSIPRGFYLRTDNTLEVGAIVTVRANDVAPAYARMRDFTDPTDRFIKRVAAVYGDQVCAHDQRMNINDGEPIRRAERDAAGHELPQWTGCRTLQNEVLLLGDTPDSFDGRYYGPISVDDIEGVWTPIWVW